MIALLSLSKTLTWESPPATSLHTIPDPSGDRWVFTRRAATGDRGGQ